MNAIVLDTEQIKDLSVRECMEKISEVINGAKFIAGQFEIFEVDVTNTTSTIKFPHRLGFKPSDVWVTWTYPTSTIVIKYDLIDDKYLAFTSSAECKVRIAAGRTANG